MTQLNQNTTDLQSILDAVNALPEATTVSGEIAITENGTYDVAEYATANVNVQSAPVLLWTNASPTSEFAAQKISVASGYDAYLVEMRYYTHTDGRRISYVPLGVGGEWFVTTQAGGSSPNQSGRKVATATSSVTFDQGYYRAGTLWSATNNAAIPTRIWGVKFTL